MGGPRWAHCPQCHSYGPTRTLYIRVPGKGFVAVGWVYLDCNHAHYAPADSQAGESRESSGSSSRRRGRRPRRLE